MLKEIYGKVISNIIALLLLFLLFFKAFKFYHFMSMCIARCCQSYDNYLSFSICCPTIVSRVLVNWLIRNLSLLKKLQDENCCLKFSMVLFTNDCTHFY